MELHSLSFFFWSQFFIFRHNFKIICEIERSRVISQDKFQYDCWATKCSQLIFEKEMQLTEHISSNNCARTYTKQGLTSTPPDIPKIGNIIFDIPSRQSMEINVHNKYFYRHDVDMLYVFLFDRILLRQSPVSHIDSFVWATSDTSISQSKI